MIFLRAFVFSIAAQIVSASVSAQTLTVVSWGGAHTVALTNAFYEPFEREFDVDVSSLHYSGGLGQLRAQVESEAVVWDVLDLTAEDVLMGCENGWLEPLPLEQLLPGAEDISAEDDFYDHALTNCGVAYASWSMLNAVWPGAFENKSPRSISDVFDVETFPGKRGFYRSPRGLLEWALLAEGVNPRDVYSRLATDAGIEQSLMRLSALRPSIVWWDDVDEHARERVSKDIPIGAVFSSTMMQKNDNSHNNTSFIWDGQLMNYSYLSIARGSLQFANAWRFIRFVTRYEQMPLITNWTGYSPTRRSSLRRIGARFLPTLSTSDENRALALHVDADWWRNHGDAAEQRFVDWLMSETSSN
ncbi:MAG: extracellular solute-binding protein [Pseudomonadota bacterium]